MANFFRNFLAGLHAPAPVSESLAMATATTTTTPETPMNPFSLDHECYADSRHFLQNKPMLRHVASQLQHLKSNHADEEDAGTAFASALDATDISLEEALDVTPSTLLTPLVALPDIAAIACRECGRTMPVIDPGVVRHVKKYHIDRELTARECNELTVKVRDSLLNFGGLTASGAWWIPHGVHFFPSLQLSVKGIACGVPNCGWLSIAGTKGKDHFKVGKQHAEEYHAKILESNNSIHANLIYPLPLQRVESLDKGAGFVYFITCLPRTWTDAVDPVLEGEIKEKRHKGKKRKYESRRRPEEKERRRRRKEGKRAERKAATESG